MKKYVIIVASGSGTRMGTDIPKQFLLLKNLPVLMHTINRFIQFDNAIGIILVLPEDQHGYWNDLCEQYNFDIPHIVTYGGITRFHSVQNGLQYVEENGLVAVHDGVRPLVSVACIERCFFEAENNRAVIPVIEPYESVRQMTDKGSVAVDRIQYRLVQTPQVFLSSLLIKAYKQPYHVHFTDDASVVEQLGETICLVEGDRSNIKITTPIDLHLAGLLLNE